MANEEQLAILRHGVDVWNKWRVEVWDKLRYNSNKLYWLDLRGAVLRGAILRNAKLSAADLTSADLTGADLNGANLHISKLTHAILWGADLGHAKLDAVTLIDAVLCESDLSWASLVEANLNRANFSRANLSRANLSRANLSGANLSRAILNEGVDLSSANLSTANLSGTTLRNADLRDANLSYANLFRADLLGADLKESNLREANLSGANLSGANLSKTNLTSALLVGTMIDKVKISESSVYAVNVWDLEGEFEEQKDLVITRTGEPAITVDNIRVAQFIYLILNNEELRNVINTITSKSVLILGRFSLPERKSILDALRNKLREYNLLPIVFDFERPTDKDFTETIKTLAGLSYFVIADVTNPKSSPLELQATVPDYQIPFVPIIQEGENPFAMMVDLQKKYNWVLPTKSYDSIETLMAALKPGIIDPAVEMRNKLRLVKAQKHPTESLKDYLDKSL